MKNILTALFLLSSTCFCDVLSTDGKIRFDIQMDGQPEMTLNSTGLAIGDLLPSSNLHVNGNAIISEQLFVGGSSGSSNLNVNGTIGYGIQMVSGNATLGNSSVVLVDSSSDNVLLTLPDPSSISGRLFQIKKINLLNNVYIVSSNSHIDVNSGYSLNSGSLGALEVLSDGDNKWSILSSFSSNSLWSPSALSTLMWFDAADSTTIHLSSSTGNVNQWDDKSGSDFHLLQAIDTYQPTYEEGVAFSNLKIIKTTTSHVMSGSSVTLNNNNTIFIVFSQTSNSRTYLTTIGGDTHYVGTGSSWQNFRLIHNNDVNVGLHPYPSMASIFTAWSAPSDYELFFDGTSVLSLATEPNVYDGVTSTFRLNSRFSTPQFSPNAEYAEVIYFNSTLSALNRQKVEGYLAWKWDLQDNLPPSHLYKSFPPRE